MNNSLQRYRRLLADYLQPQRGRVLALALLIFSNIGLQLVNPQLMRRFLDQATTGAALKPSCSSLTTFPARSMWRRNASYGSDSSSNPG